MLLDMEGALQVLIEGGSGAQGVKIEEGEREREREGGRSVDEGGINILKSPKLVFHSGFI
jgi:hypothetical protein